MKKVTFSFVHYGSDYLEYALASLYGSVDKMFVFYTDKPNQGILPTVERPESKVDILECCAAFADKIEWVDDGLDFTGEHIDLATPHLEEVIQRYAPDADIVVQLDADEVWQEGALEHHVATAVKYSSRLVSVPWITFWRSFGWVCRDNAWVQPRRIWYRNGKGRVGSTGKPILHFGWARRERDIEYKINCWGHAPELRENFFYDLFLGWQPGKGNVHPVQGNGFWNPEVYDKSQLPELLKQHP